MAIPDRAAEVMRSIAAPLLVLLLAIAFSAWALTNMEPTSGPDSTKLLQKGFLAIILYVFLLLVIRFREHRASFVLLFVGLTIVFMGQVENVLDEFVNITYGGLAFDLEDLDSIGLVSAGLGLLIYTNTLTKARAKTEQSRRETELYATLLRHDLRNDLQAVLGYIELAGSEGQNVEELLESARMATIRMVRLVKAFSIKSDAPAGTLESLVEHTAKDAEKTHQGIRVRTDIEKGLAETEIHGGFLIRVAIENLLRNASQYAGENPIVNIIVRRAGDQVELLVSDNGPGIPTELRERVFDRGFSSSDSGLGLYLARTILKGCGGSIELVDSDSGAAFKILLPRPL